MSKLTLLYSILCVFVTSGQCQAQVCPTPSTKNNGVWWCNKDQNPSSYCYLKCNPGYAALFTSTSCISGVWTDLDKMECEQSVFLLTGGSTAYHEDKNISSEIYQGMKNVTCTNHLPYLKEYRTYHTSFVHNGLLYTCGGLDYDYEYYRCASLNMTDQSGQWKNHIFSNDLHLGLKTVVIRDKLYFIDGFHEDYTFWTALPLDNEPKLNRVINLPFLFGHVRSYSCIVQTTGDSFIVIGDHTIYRYNKAAINNGVSTAIITEYPRPYGMWTLGCGVVEEGGKEWLVLAGLFDGNLSPVKVIRLDLNGPQWGNQWESLGQLNVPRHGFRMSVKENGIFAMGGYKHSDGKHGYYLDTVETFDWESKKWTLIAQKLNTGRYRFGIVEVPASIFNCEKNQTV